MTTPAGVPGYEPATGRDPDEGPQDLQTEDVPETVGADDAAADAARSGADVDLNELRRDTEGVPVGRADAEADVARTTSDRDEDSRGL